MCISCKLIPLFVLFLMTLYIFWVHILRNVHVKYELFYFGKLHETVSNFQFQVVNLLHKTQRAFTQGAARFSRFADSIYLWFNVVRVVHMQSFSIPKDRKNGSLCPFILNLCERYCGPWSVLFGELLLNCL
jgi:hypothetical protein